MRVAVTRIEGVSTVTVSLKEGMASIRFTPSNHVTVDQIREVVRSNGFTPKEAEVRVTGVLVSAGDTLVLSVPGSEESFLLQDGPGAGGKVAELRKERADARVTVTGQVPAVNDRSRRARRPLLVQSYVVVGVDVDRVRLRLPP